MKPSARILIVDDESAIRDMISFALSSGGYAIFQAENVKEARQLIAEHVPDIILLDWMLPDISGIEFAKELKRNDTTKHIRIIMLTARADEDSKIRGLDIGADDYVTKPFSPGELDARIKAILRRSMVVTERNQINVGRLSLDASTHLLEIDQKKIHLTSVEFKLLHFFMTHPNRIFSRDQLLNYVWGGDDEISDRTVDVHVRRLRKHLEPFACDHYIKTIRSHGYQFSGAPL